MRFLNRMEPGPCLAKAFLRFHFCCRSWRCRESPAPVQRLPTRAIGQVDLVPTALLSRTETGARRWRTTDGRRNTSPKWRRAPDRSPVSNEEKFLDRTFSNYGEADI